jgi:hypothetical protein
MKHDDLLPIADKCELAAVNRVRALNEKKVNSLRDKNLVLAEASQFFTIARGLRDFHTRENSI